MRVLLLATIICYLITCSCNNVNPKEEDRFRYFLSSCDTLKPGFEIFEHDFKNYVDKIFDENSNLVMNPLLKPIKGSELEFLKSKYLINKQYNYFKVFKLKINDNYLVILVQIDDERSEFWVTLNTFSSSGKLFDTLTFAGQKMYDHNTYGKIDKNLKITTLSYFEIVPDSVNFDHYFATEVKNVYFISNDGHFVLNESKKDRAYFTDVGDNKVVTRVDTIPH